VSDPQRGSRIRRMVRSAIRVATAVWAGLWGFTFAVGLLDGQTSWAIRVPGLILIGLLGFGPLIGHIWWARTHPLPAPAAPAAAPRAVHPPYSPLGRLERIADAADQLRAGGWIPESDHLGIRGRVARLQDLVVADERSVALGGQPSPVIGQEIERLHRSVVGLLDASIDSAAVAPGDADLDSRLTQHLDALHSRGQAIGELEGRAEPFGHQQPG
jgi:hypothetical protein